MAGKKATREGYGDALVELGKLHDDVYVLDADLASATKSGVFKKAFPDRFIDCGIAEGNMMGIAAGLASCGLKPFASSFAMFAAGRAYEQVRNLIAHTHLNVKVCASHAGISVGEDGATHQCLEDIALMTAIPGMVVVSPSDYVETLACIKAAYEYDGPMYIRTCRYGVPIINDNEDYKFEIGKAIRLRDGKDVSIIANGLEVGFALEAADILAEQGISAEVINMHTIKPIDKDIVIEAAKKTGKIVTVEDHSVVGGVGSAVCNVLCENYPARVHKIGINDEFGESGSAAALLEHYGLDGKGIAKNIAEWL